MLRSQYGVATSSSATPVLHAEDAQPNETIYKRRHGLPPQIGSTWKNNYRDSGMRRGSHRAPWTQFAFRGSGSRRGKGNFQSNRGGHNSNQSHAGHVQPPSHPSIPPIATLPDIEYHTPLTSPSSSSSSQITPSHQPPVPDSSVIRENRLLQAEPHYTVPDEADPPHFSPPSFSERQMVDNYHWLHRSRSPSPKLPPSALKRRKFERQPTHVSNRGRSEALITQSAEPMPPKANRPLLPGRHRRFEDAFSIPALHSLEPLVPQVQTAAVSSIEPNILTNLSVKQEPHTPSPARSLRMERSLTTSSCKFYPIPELCKKSYPDFKERRKAFFNEKMRELSRLGLKGVNSFFRDDGLAIEWKSKVPVWSDTLLPEFADLASAIKRAHQINHQASVKSSCKRKRPSVDRHSRESSHMNNDKMEPNESNRPRHSLENTRIQDWAAEIEIVEPSTMPFRVSSSSTPMSSIDHGSHPSTILIPLLDNSEVICLDPEDNQCDTVPTDMEPLNIVTSVIQQPKTSAMNVDTLTPPKPVRRMLFKPVLPFRRNQPTTSSAQDSTPVTSDPAKSLSTSLYTAEEHSKAAETEINSRLQNHPPQQKTTPRPPLLSPRRDHFSHTPTERHPLPIAQPSTHETLTQEGSKSHTPSMGDIQATDEVEVQETGGFLSKDEDHGNATDPDAELVDKLLLRTTPEEPNNHSSNPRQEEIMEDLQLHAGHEDEDDEVENKDVEPSVSAEEDMAVVERLATQFLQRYLPLFDVDRLKLEAAYAKNALFSCRVHHNQEPSFSMAGLFAPESLKSRALASISAIQNGRAQIVNRLLELGPHRFCPRGVPRTVNYDVVPLSSATAGGILLTVHGEVVNPHLAGPQMDHVLSVDQSFVLRKRGLEDEDEDEDEDEGMDRMSSTASNLWPLVAVSHQMTVRDAVSLPCALASQIQGP